MTGPLRSVPYRVTNCSTSYHDVQLTSPSYPSLTPRPSLYARYVKEREGFSIIEHPHGFATYKITGDACYIRDIYVVPERRHDKLASHLADEVALLARQQQCTKLVGTVSTSAYGHEASLRVLLAYGFDLSECHEGYLVLTKILRTEK